MEEKDLFRLVSEENQIEKVMKINEKTEQFGLVLSQEDAKVLVENRMETLREQQRIEFEEGILPKLMFTFCDSPYIYQENCVETISRLQEIFFLYKNESMDELTDDELLEYMKTAFDGRCEGSLEFLEETALEEFARDIRRGGKSFFGKYYRTKGSCYELGRRGVSDDEL